MTTRAHQIAEQIIDSYSDATQFKAVAANGYGNAELYELAKQAEKGSK